MIDLSEFWDAVDGTDAGPDAEALFLDEPVGRLRRANMDHYLRLVAEQGTDTMLLAEAPGWRGMTNTGVPFLSVRELTARPGVVTGAADGDRFQPPVAPTALWEASSRVVWAALADWHGPLPVSWPVFPHHPFIAGNPQSNRTPRPAEVRAGVPAVRALAQALNVRRFIAVGRKAQGALADAGIDAIAVRHPAQGGARQFTEQLAALAPRPR